MRLIALVLVLGFTASAVLELRTRRLEMLHAMAVLHLDMDRHRRAAWDLQHRVSEATSPAALAEAIALAEADAEADANADAADRSDNAQAASQAPESADRGPKRAETATVRGFESIPYVPAERRP